MTAAPATIEIGATPFDTVWTCDRVSLWRYRSPAGVARRPDLPPVLIIHGFVGRQTMTDLLPDRSLVGDLLGAGADVWCIDWGNHGPEDRGVSFGDCVAGYLPAAIDAMGACRPALFGICQGGVMAAMLAARMPPERLSGLAVAVTPIDFHADIDDAAPEHGMIHLWLRNLEADDVDRLIGARGVLSGDWLGAVFEQLAPVRRILRLTVDLPELADTSGRRDVFDAMELWLSDRPDVPGVMARELLIGLYQENRLAEGRFVIDGDTVDLSRIAVPVLNLVACSDHIVPPPCARALGRLIGTDDYTEIALPSGHIGAFVSERSRPVLIPAVLDWLNRLA